MGRNYEPFDYEITRSGAVRIFRGGHEVVTVRGQAASTLGAKLGRGEESDQAALQRATGNYKRGNERR